MSQSLDNGMSPLRPVSRHALPRSHYPIRTSGLITIRRPLGPGHEVLSLINLTCVDSSRYLTKSPTPNRGLLIQRQLLRHPRPPPSLLGFPPLRHPKQRTISQPLNRPRITKVTPVPCAKTRLRIRRTRRTRRTCRINRDLRSPPNLSIPTTCIQKISMILLPPTFNLTFHHPAIVLKPLFRPRLIVPPQLLHLLRLYIWVVAAVAGTTSNSTGTLGPPTRTHSVTFVGTPTPLPGPLPSLTILTILT